MSVYVYVLTNSVPDYSASGSSPRSVHLTPEGAMRAFADGKYADKKYWRMYSTPTRKLRTWSGPDGFGSIIEMELLP